GVPHDADHNRTAALAQAVDRVASGRHANRHRANRHGTRDVVRRVADHDDICRIHVTDPTCARARDCDRYQRVAIRRVVTKRPAPEVPPEIEVLELDARAIEEVARQQTQRDIGALLQRIEQLADTWHHRFRARAWPFDLVTKMHDVSDAKILEQARI